MAGEKIASWQRDLGLTQSLTELLRETDNTLHTDTPNAALKSAIEGEIEDTGDVVLLSSFEERVEDILNKIQIKHITQHHINYSDENGSKMWTDESGQQRPYIYTPDFDLESPKYQGKTVILEPHGGRYFNDKFFEKMIRFMDSKEHNSDYYLIMITDRPVAEINDMLADYARRKHIKRNLDVSNICDKMVTTRMRTDEEVQKKIEGSDPKNSAKPHWADAQKVSDELGGMKRFDDREFIRTLIRLKDDGIVD